MHTILGSIANLRTVTKALLRKQRGQAMIMAVGFLFAGTALVTGALTLASATSRSSHISIDNLMSQYSAISGSEYLAYLLLYDPEYAQNPTPTTITVNGEDITLNVTVPSYPPPPPGIPPVENGREFRVTKEVTPTSAEPGVLTAYTYTIHVTNMDIVSHSLTSIRDNLPSGFSYVSGSSSGIANVNPVVNGQGLKWDLNPNVVFQPQESRTQTFQTTATLAEGNYGNEAWVEPGGGKTSTDLTARITVGSPPSDLWQGAHATIQKTVTPSVVAAGVSTLTYTITLTNTGSVDLTLSQVKDLLAPGLLRYVPGTTTGLTTAEPFATVQSTPYGDRQSLLWSVSVDFAPGQTRTLSFQASGDLAPGEYWNEAWADFNKIGTELYTWPTAVVEAMAVADTVSDDGSTVVSSRVWFGNSRLIRSSWHVDHR